LGAVCQMCFSEPSFPRANTSSRPSAFAAAARAEVMTPPRDTHGAQPPVARRVYHRDLSVCTPNACWVVSVFRRTTQAFGSCGGTLLPGWSTAASQMPRLRVAARRTRVVGRNSRFWTITLGRFWSNAAQVAPLSVDWYTPRSADTQTRLLLVLSTATELIGSPDSPAVQLFQIVPPSSDRNTLPLSAAVVPSSVDMVTQIRLLSDGSTTIALMRAARGQVSSGRGDAVVGEGHAPF